LKEVLIDTLVLPSLPVVDYRTDIHGIQAKDLKKVMFTFRHAQVLLGFVVEVPLCHELTDGLMPGRDASTLLLQYCPRWAWSFK